VQQLPDSLVPNAVEAEEALLNAVMTLPDMLPDVLKNLTPDDFFIVKNGWVFEAVTRLYEGGKEIDPVTVEGELRRMGYLQEIGGASYLTYLSTCDMRWMSLPTYGSDVLGTSIRRTGLQAASEIAQLMHAEDMNITEALDQAETALARAREKMPTDDMLRGSEAIEFYQRVLKRRVQPTAPGSLSLPWEAFAPYVTIKRGGLILITGFSGEGKTMFLEALADWWAMLGDELFFITTEMAREDLLDRMVCRHTGISYSHVISNTADVDTIIATFRVSCARWLPKIDYYETNRASAKTIWAHINRAVQKGKRIIFLDYLGEKIAFDTGERTLKQAIDNFIVSLDALGTKTGTTFVIASQLTETDFGARSKNSRVPHETAKLHLRLTTQKEKENRVYNVDNRCVGVRAGDTSPMMRISFDKNRYGPTPDSLYLFKDGPRFRFLDEREVTWSVAFNEKQLEDAEQPQMADEVMTGGRGAKD
jgi:replicative DNA helicase